MMQRISILSFILMIAFHSAAQVVINEIDSDSPGIDDKEFIELKTDEPKMSLEGYILVLFNGSTSGGNRSYFALDLDNYTTDINGLLLIGSHLVSPVPQLIIAPNTIQNGADAVAIYKGDTTDFPEWTLATQNNLIDALVYDTNDPDASTLLKLLGLSKQINEGSNGNKNTESIQRNNKGSYFVGPPTPGRLNDGSGIPLNGIDISVSELQMDEGAAINISFTAEKNVDKDLFIQFSLNNATFDTSDYEGDTSLVIMQGQRTVSTTILIIDDDEDEGDEEMIVQLGRLPDKFVALKNHIIIRIVDNDFVVAPWGTPLSSTYEFVSGSQPSDYYENINGLKGGALHQELQNIIADADIVRAQTYADVIDILKEADQNPKNSNEIWLVYSEEGRAKLDFQTTSNNRNKWNREHTFPRSRGGFYSIKADEIIDGKDIYWSTNADSLRHANSDAHALRSADAVENSRRGNKHYGEYNGPQGTKGSFKGDVARSAFYMAIRYNDLSVVKGSPTTKGQLGDLTTLLKWHRADPPDDFEMNRNNVIYKWQFNRNPFIDLPELIEYLWGNKVGEIWDPLLTNNDFRKATISIYPNPGFGQVYVEGLTPREKLYIYSEQGILYDIYTLTNDPFLSIQLHSGKYHFVTYGSDGIKSKMVTIF